MEDSERQFLIPPVSNNNEAENPVAATGTITSSAANLSNTILGTGMLAMSYAFASVGLLQGITLILLTSSASAFGLTLLSKGSQILGNRKTSFYSLCRLSFPKAAVILDAAIAIKCFGVSISYLVVVGDLMPEIYRNLGLGDTTKQFWITIAIATIAPLSFLRRLDSLKSMLALVAVLYLLSIVIGFAIIWPVGMPSHHFIAFDDIVWWNNDLLILAKTAPVFVFAFTCHQNIFSIHNELVDNTLTRVERVIFTSIGSAFLIYTMVGVVGYLTFGNEVASNIITMYPKSNVILVGEMCIALLVLLSYPLQCHPCRASLDKVVTALMCQIQPMIDQPTSSLKHAAMTTFILASTYLVAVSVKDLSTILAFVGATGSTTICYILPGLLYYKIAQEQDFVCKYIGASLTAFGIVFMIVCVTLQMR